MTAVYLCKSLQHGVVRLEPQTKRSYEQDLVGVDTDSGQASTGGVWYGTDER